MILAVPSGGGGSGGGVSDHSLLTNLSADDHPQYITLTPSLAARNLIVPGADITPLTIKAAAGQTASLLQITDSANTPVYQFLPTIQKNIIAPPSTNTIVPVLRLTRNTSGAAGSNGIGASLEFAAETSTMEDQTIGSIRYKWESANNSNRYGRLELNVFDFTERTGLRINSNGSSTPSVLIGTESSDAKFAVFMDGTGVIQSLDCNTHDGLSYLRISRFGDPFQWVGVAGPGYSGTLDTIQANDLFIRTKTTGNYVHATDNKHRFVTAGAHRAAIDADGVTSAAAFLLGDASTDGSWRIIRDGSDLKFQRREAGVWVDKESILA